MGRYRLLIRPTGPSGPGFQATVDDDNEWRVVNPDELRSVSILPNDLSAKVAYWESWAAKEAEYYRDTADYSPDRAGRYAEALVNGYKGTEILEGEGAPEPLDLMVY